MLTKNDRKSYNSPTINKQNCEAERRASNYLKYPLRIRADDRYRDRAVTGGGVLGEVPVEKLFCSFFNPLISLYIYYDQYEKYGEMNKIILFPALRFHGNGGHL